MMDIVLRAAAALAMNFVGIFAVATATMWTLRFCGRWPDPPWWGFPLWMATFACMLAPAAVVAIFLPWQLMFRVIWK